MRVDNWRWAGVPFYLRTGKRMAEGARIISIAFREPPQSMFPTGSGIGESGPDHLTFDLDESGRLSLSFYGKRPGPGMALEKLSMQFSLVDVDREGDTLEAYERLIRDAMKGDHTLFTTADGIERLWEVSAPLLENPPPVEPYEQGTWGPESITELIAPHKWRLPFVAPLARGEDQAGWLKSGPAGRPGRRRSPRRAASTLPAGIERSPASSPSSAARLSSPGDEPEDPARRGERRVGQRHPAPTLVLAAGHRHQPVADVEHGVARDQRGGVPVGPEAEVDEVESARKLGGVARGGGVEVRRRAPASPAPARTPPPGSAAWTWVRLRSGSPSAAIRSST